MSFSKAWTGFESPFERSAFSSSLMGSIWGSKSKPFVHRSKVPSRGLVCFIGKLKVNPMGSGSFVGISPSMAVAIILNKVSDEEVISVSVSR